MYMHTNRYTAIRLCSHYFDSFVIHVYLCIQIRLYLCEIYDYIFILLYIRICETDLLDMHVYVERCPYPVRILDGGFH